ncbi:MAG: glycosyltransferase [Micrococcales bacterium]|nr:glycosyltransferase [Micrococcales bacterium]
MSTFRASVVVPAHDEERSIPRLLRALEPRVVDGSLEVVVVCNGCTDRTAEVVRATWPAVTVVEIDEPSKYLALRVGDRTANALPRVYVDADVVIDGDDVLLLADTVREGAAVLAAAPRRELDLEGASPPVRGYYRVWARLPAVQEGLYGRGVLAVGRAGFDRVADRPDVTGDDLYLDLAFGRDERVVVDGARSLVRGPRRTTDLVRRRVRAAEGNRELYASAPERDSRSGSIREVARILRASRGDPRTVADVAAFVTVTVAARAVAGWRRLRGGERGWLRDESSRA